MSRLRRVLEALSLAPFEAMLGVIAVISGVSTLNGDPPASIADTLPQGLILGWAGALLTGAPLLLAGLVGERPRVEQAGLVLLAAATLVYGAAITAIQPAAALTAAATYLLFGGACLLRVRVLTRAIAAARLAREHDDRD